MVNFPERLKELRCEKGITQSSLARLIDVSKAIVSRWESGLREPTLSSLIKLAKFFDVSLDYMSGLKDW